MAYKFISKDRTYKEWSVCNSDTFERIEGVEFNPLRDKLFNQDIFDLEQDGTAKVHNSVIRSSQYISAVLMISKKKTFGNYNKKHLYKCVPDDVRLPVFLVPCKLKILGFLKL